MQAHINGDPEVQNTATNEERHQIAKNKSEQENTTSDDKHDNNTKNTTAHHK